MQPQRFSGGLCSAVILDRTLRGHWIAIPCQQSKQGATFLCETKLSSRQTSVKRNISRTITECPKQTIHVNSSCVHVTSYVYKHNYQSEKYCYEHGMVIFQLPHFLLYFDDKILNWEQQEYFPFSIFYINGTSLAYFVWPNYREG